MLFPVPLYPGAAAARHAAGGARPEGERRMHALDAYACSAQQLSSHPRSHRLAAAQLALAPALAPENPQNQSKFS